MPAGLPACLPACLLACLPACLPACLSVCLPAARLRCASFDMGNSATDWYVRTCALNLLQNGGPVAGSAGASHANNFPLRGGKHSNWEGGIRVVAFASGGIIEPSRHGVILRGIMHNAGE